MAKFEEVKKILKSKMALEQCDSDVMPYFTDYYWVPEDQITELVKEICRLFEEEKSNQSYEKPGGDERERDMKEDKTLVEKLTKARQEGRKEVVEWVREYVNLHYSSNMRELLCISKENWEAKLKSWNISA